MLLQFFRSGAFLNPIMITPLGVTPFPKYEGRYIFSCKEPFK